MKKRRIAIDCDDVLIESSPLIINYYNTTYGASLRLADMYSHDLEQWEVSDKETAIRRVDEYLNSSEYLDIPPLQETIDAITQLSKYHELHVVTGRSEAIAKTTKDMLQKYFPGVFHSIEFTNYITIDRVSRSKADACQRLDADLLIDDHLHHTKVVAECGIEALLFGDYPWNQADTLPKNVRRVKGWQEVAGLLLP